MIKVNSNNDKSGLLIPVKMGDIFSFLGLYLVMCKLLVFAELEPNAGIQCYRNAGMKWNQPLLALVAWERETTWNGG